MRARGLHRYRFKENPEEQRFAEAWEEQQSGNTLAYLLHMGEGRGRPTEPNDREHAVAATVIQWLGSPVGQAWLAGLGYERKATEKRSGTREAQ